MKRIKKFQSIILLVILLVGTFALLSHPTQAVIRQFTTVGIADQDSCTSTGLPDYPIGSTQDTISAGNNTVNILEAYFHFNFSNKSITIQKAELSLCLWGKAFAGPDLNLTVCIIEESWDEQSLTWNNAPPKGEVIGYLLYENNTMGIYKIDISSSITGRTNFSVCVYMELDNYIENYAPIASSEEYIMSEQAPQIIWTNLEDATITVNTPNALSNWEDSLTESISWISQGRIGGVRIEICEGYTPIENISTYEANDGEYSWTIPESLNLKGSNYRIKISDYQDSDVYGFSEIFAINQSDYYIPGYFLIVLSALIIFVGFILVLRISKNSRYLTR